MGYSAIQAARLSGCSRAQVDAWRRIGLVVPDDADAAGPYCFRDLVALRMVTDGEHVWACRDDGQILDALSHGQLALFVAVDRFADEVEAEVRDFDADRRAFVEELRARDGHPSEGG